MAAICYICPLWGGDDNYKKLIDVRLRLDMLFGVFSEHPYIIVTRLSHKALQDQLYAQKIPFDVTGIIGSDSARMLAKRACANRKSYFMTGQKIPLKYKNHSAGTCMALRAKSFIVGMRKCDLGKRMHYIVDKRPVVAWLDSPETEALSSTEVKKAIERKMPLDNFISPSIAQIIRQHQLYGFKS